MAKAVHPDAVRGRAAAERASPGSEQAAAAAFLRIVEAYEVLSDPERRRMYDASVDSGLPGVIRTAAASSTSQQQRDGGAATGASPGPGWRFGWDGWARDGPAGAPARRGRGGGGAARGVFDALQRYRDTLEADLHSALLHAFFGPRLDGLQPGELPPSFEAEERSSPDASGDLLHIVSGRTLLGCVRLRRRPALEDGRGGECGPRALPWVARLAGGSPLLPDFEPGQPQGNEGAPGTAAGYQIPPRLSRWQLQQLLGAGAEELFNGEQACAAVGGGGPMQDAAQWTKGNSSCSSGSSGRSGGSGGSGGIDCGGGTGPACAPAVPDLTRRYSGTPYPGEDTCSGADGGESLGSGGALSGDGDGDGEWLSEEEGRRWQAALLAAHRLQGQYDWEAPAEGRAVAPQLTAGASVPGDVISALEKSIDGRRSAPGALPPQQRASEEGGGSMGASSLLRAWQMRMSDAAASEAKAKGGETERGSSTDEQAQVQEVAPGTVQSGHDRNDAAGGGNSAALNASGTEHAYGSSFWSAGAPADDMWPPGLLSSATEGLAQGVGEAFCGSWMGAAPPSEAGSAAEAPPAGCGGECEPGAQQGAGEPPPKRWRLGRGGGRRAFLSALLRRGAPSVEWNSCRWDFDDGAEGVTVVEAAVGPPGDQRVMAVAVRDEGQEQRPVKVYVGGAFVAALVQDAVLAPFSGDMLSYVHRSWTPGVSHDIIFYRTRLPQQRLLCRMRRSWLPPSGAWLFPPRDECHDVGGWLVEWEGFNCRAKPGWLHPAVFLCSAALQSVDAEGRSSWLQRRWRAAASRLFPSASL